MLSPTMCYWPESWWKKEFDLFSYLIGVGIAHGTDSDTALDIGFINKCRQIDKAMTALILDLKQRGLLEETLVVWGGEFGRTPMLENREGKQNIFKGRDHHTEAFTIWMAGGGIKKGVSYGETDEIGYGPVSGKTDAYDIQATY